MDFTSRLEQILASGRTDVEPELIEIQEVLSREETQTESLYNQYYLIAKIASRTNRIDQSYADDGVLSDFVNNRFHQFDTSTSDKIIGFLNPLYDRLDHLCRNIPEGYDPKTVIRKGYLSDRQLPNQISLESLQEDEIEITKQMFEGMGFDKMMRSYYQSNFAVANIRVWRFYHGLDVGIHFDKLPVNTIKLMCWRGDVTTDHGCFEALVGKKWVPIDGRNPCLLVDSNNVRHRALSPKEGNCRDTIEFTIMPYIGSESIYVDAGRAAGSPVNPFRSWQEMI